MISDVLNQVKSRKQFYRDHYRKFIKVLMVAQIIIILLIVAIIFVKLTQPPRKFYATSNVGGITEVKALDKPNNSDTPLID